MAFLFNRIKASNAPKTEDPRFDEANAIFKGLAIEVGQFRGRVDKLLKLLKDLSGAYLKFSTDLNAWLGEGANPAVLDSSGQLASVARTLDAQVTDQFALSVDPNFLNPLVAWEREVSEVTKLRSVRMEACQTFDRDRELQRLAETAKKPKQAEIDKARAKTEESHGKYERANSEFIEAVNRLNDKRGASVVDPFKHMFAISCQLIDAMAGCGPAEVEPAAVPVSVPAPAGGEGQPTSQRVTQPPAQSASQARPEWPSQPAPQVQAPLAAASATPVRARTPFDDDEGFERGGWADDDEVTFKPPPPPKIDQRNPFANPFDAGGGSDEFADWGSQYSAGHRKSTGEGDYGNPFD